MIEIFAPAQKAVDTIRQWLEDAGIDAGRISQSANKQWIQFDADVEEAEQLFKTEYHVYEHIPTGKTNVACDEYVPQCEEEESWLTAVDIMFHLTSKSTSTILHLDSGCLPLAESRPR